MIKIRMKTDTSRLDRLERNIAGNTMDALTEAGEALKADIRSHWSIQSPSSPGNPPAVLTGNLDSSVEVDRQGRDVLGRFAGKDALVLFVRIDTTKGDNPLGRKEYASVLEDEMNRPFVQPAVDRMSQNFPHFFRRIFK